jgi:hypothetical protein
VQAKPSILETSVREFAPRTESVMRESPSHRTPERGKYAARVAPYLGLALFCGALLWPLWIGRSLYWGDILLYFEPMYAFAGETLRQGVIPLWNPQILCGQPFVGNPQMGVFYPASALLPFTSSWLFLSLTSGLHLFLCGVFTYLYLLRWTTHRTAALAGACVYMGSACLLGRLQFPPMIQTAAYFPALLWRLDRSVDAPGLRSGVWLSVVIGLTILAAHAQIAYLILLCSSLYAVCRLIRQSERESTRSERRKRFLRRAAPLLAFGLLGLLLTAGQTLPALQLLRESSREHLSPFQANRFALEPQHLLNVIAPRFTGHPASGDYWGGKNAWETALFVGWIPLALAFFAVRWGGRSPAVRFWCLVGFLGIWLAFGVWGGLFWLAYTLLPGFSHFHDPARFLFWTTFALAVLTAFGWEALFRHSVRFRSRPWAPLALAGILLPLWWYGQDWNPTTSPQNLRASSSREQALRSEMQQGGDTGGRLYLPRDNDLWKRFVTQGYSDYGDSSARGVSAWLRSFLPNLNMRERVAIFPGYEPVPFESMTDMDRPAFEAWERGEPNIARLLTLLGTPIVVLPQNERVFLPGFRDLASETSRNQSGVHFVKRVEPAAHAWLVRRVVRVEGRKRVTASLSNPDFDPRAVAIVSGVRGSDAAFRELLAPEAGNTPPGRVRVEASRLHALTLHAEAGDAPAFLVLSSAGYPGWRAEIDGKPGRPVHADGGLIGIPLPAGEHRVVFRYAPEVYRIGTYLSLLAAGLVAAFLGASAGERKRGSQRRQEFRKEWRKYPIGASSPHA